MDLNSKTITAEHSQWTRDLQVLVEGSLSLPEGMTPIQSLLEVSGTNEITETTLENGKLSLSGVAYFKILYLDAEGGFSGFDAESEFSRTVELPDAPDEAQVLAWGTFSDISAEQSDPSHIAIHSVIDVDIYHGANAQYSLLDIPADDPGLHAKQQACRLATLSCVRAAKTYVQAQVRVPQSMPAVKRILSERGYAMLRKVTVEEGRAAAEGELRIFLIYESMDKNAPLQTFEETLPFGDVLHDDALRADSQVFCLANLETLASEIDAQDGDLIRISAAIGLHWIGRAFSETSVVTDLFDERHETQLSHTALCGCLLSEGTCLKKILRLSAEIPAGSPEVSRILFSSAYPSILSAHAEGGVLHLEGAIHLLLCYTTAQAGIHSTALLLPFETELSYPQALDGAALFFQSFCEYTLAEGSGREIELKCCLDLCAWECASQEVSAVSAASLSPLAEPKPCGILVYYPDGTESRWDIAKKFKVDPAEIAHAEDDGPLPRGKKLLLLSR